MYLLFKCSHTGIDHQFIVFRATGVIVVTHIILIVPHAVPLILQPIAQQLMLTISCDNSMAMLLLERWKLEEVARKFFMKATWNNMPSKIILHVSNVLQPIPTIAQTLILE
jgi:hypothetical protein